MELLRISHSAVVSAWREREREIIRHGIHTELLTAVAWDEGGSIVPMVPDGDDFVSGVRTFGSHPNLFLYDPRPLWRALGRHWDVIDLHEAAEALCTAEILLIKLLRRNRAPYVLYSAQNIDKRFPIPFRWLEGLALRHASAISVCNVEAGHIAQKKGLGGYANYVPLGVDTSLFSPAAENAVLVRVPAANGSANGSAESTTPATGPAENPAAHHLQAEGFAAETPVRVGYVGRLADYKGVDVLLQAVTLDPRLHLRLVGAGPDETSLRDLAQTLRISDRVEFLGHHGQQDLADLYRTFDVLAVPSLPTPGWLEQFCRVAVEAMASGVPVIASDSGALPDVVGGAGILVPPGNPSALAEALLAAGTNPERRRQLIEAGLQRAKEFSWPEVGSLLVGVYRQLAAQQSEWPPVEVLVVAYGSADLLKQALAPLADKFSLTVVDNSSSLAIADITAAMGGRYIDAGANLGFAAAVNIGLAAIAAREADRPGDRNASPKADSKADVLLLNPDAVIGPEGIQALSRRLHAHPRLASVGPAQIDLAGRASEVAWPFPSPLRSWLVAMGLGRLPARRKFVIGSILLLKRSALDEVGGFDDRFFLYAEETDWAYRAHRAGWRHAVAEEVTALHHGAGTSSDPARRELLFHSSQERYLRKHFGALGWTVARAAVIIGAGIRSSVLAGSRAVDARRRLRLYLTGPVKSAQRAAL